MILINKILFVILFLSILVVFRQSFFLIQTFLTDDRRFVLPKRELLYLGLALSYILTCIFTGVKI